MNPTPCLKIAQRISTLLAQELGQGVDAARMVSDPLYARDVLLVCDALGGTELGALAPRFRVALAAAQAEPDTASVGHRPSGFSASRFLGSLFGATTASPASTLDGPPLQGPRRWLRGKSTPRARSTK